MINYDEWDVFDFFVSEPDIDAENNVIIKERLGLVLGALYKIKLHFQSHPTQLVQNRSAYLPSWH